MKTSQNLTVYNQMKLLEDDILEAMTGCAVYSPSNAQASLTRLRELWALVLLENNNGSS